MNDSYSWVYGFVLLFLRTRFLISLLTITLENRESILVYGFLHCDSERFVYSLPVGLLACARFVVWFRFVRQLSTKLPGLSLGLLEVFSFLGRGGVCTQPLI